MRHGAKNVSPALLPPTFTFFELQVGKVYLQTPAAILPRRGPGEAGQHSSALDSCPRRHLVHVVTRMSKQGGTLRVVVFCDYTLDTITPSASSVARHRHITQPRRAGSDGLTAFPRRTLTLSFTKRRRDAVAELRVLLRFCSGAAGNKLRRPRINKRDVAAELSQKRRAHAVDVRHANALARRGHDGFSERPAFRSRAAHRRALVARARFAHAFRNRLLAATPDAREELRVNHAARAQL